MDQATIKQLIRAGAGMVFALSLIGMACLMILVDTSLRTIGMVNGGLGFFLLLLNYDSLHRALK